MIINGDLRYIQLEKSTNSTTYAKGMEEKQKRTQSSMSTYEAL